MQGGYQNIAIFGQYLTLCPKRYKIEPQLLWQTNRKSHYGTSNERHIFISILTFSMRELLGLEPVRKTVGKRDKYG